MARDRVASTRDLVMGQSYTDFARSGERAVTGAEIVMRGAGQRKRAAEHRARAAEHRVQAAADREQGARDRLQARADREALSRALAIAEHPRSYDLIIRLGGDEFLCAMSGMTISEARERFSVIAGELAGTSEGGALRTGFAELAADASATELIARAGSQLIASRHC